MLKPFYQGKLDTFCAIYAVLNGLRLTHGIRTLKAREILNETLLDLSARPADFNAVLTQETDYVNLVDAILDRQAAKMPLEILRPFAGRHVSVQEFWDASDEWLNGGQGRTMVFRFLRHVDPKKAPFNRHWTTADYLRGDILHLFDCSHEAEAILNIRKDSFVTSPKDVDKEHLLYIQPETVRFLRIPGA